jgi:hypothetical protein
MPTKAAKVTVKRQTQPLTGMDWLKQRMKILGYHSLEEVSKDIGINRGNLHRIFTLETAPGVEQLPALCRVLMIPLAELLVVLEAVKSADEILFDQ